MEQAEAALQPRDARVMLQLPTGGGKTHIAGALLRRWLHNGRKAVWLTHREQLADQTCGMLADAGVSAISLKTLAVRRRCPIHSQRCSHIDGPDCRQTNQSDANLGQI